MKNQLRKYSLEKRKYIPYKEHGKKILEKLFSLNEYKKAQNIICYYPLNYEPDTLCCFEDTTKNWYLPRVNGDNLDICPYCKTLIKKGSFNILEPQTEKINSYKDIDLIIIPSVAADTDGYRLGYGKGFYDRFLFSNKIKALKIVLTYSELLYKTVYPEPFDIKADIIITDKEILRI